MDKTLGFIHNMNSIRITFLFLLFPFLSIGQDLESASDITNEHLGLLVDKVSLFIGTLKRGEFDTSKELLSEKLSAQLHDDQLTQLASIIKEVDVKLIYNGIEKAMDETVFEMLHFKYSNDDSPSPQEIIKVLFNKNDKIAGFQPLKMK